MFISSKFKQNVECFVENKTFLKTCFADVQICFFFLVPDVANADKAAGRNRQYKIIFTPQKVPSSVLRLTFFLHYCADLSY